MLNDGWVGKFKSSVHSNIAFIFETLFENLINFVNIDIS